MIGKNRMTRWAGAVAAALLVSLAVPAVAQENSPSPASPAANSSDTGAAKRKYPPIPVNREVFNAHDEWFKDVARKIEDGSATTQERRAWYEMRKRYYPFTRESRPPANWRVEALRRGNLLDRRLNPKLRPSSTSSLQPGTMAVTDYTWRLVGDSTAALDVGEWEWWQGQPPSTTNPDRGGGRATAIWVNPNDRRDVLMGTADSGVWKTTAMSNTNADPNAIWTPIFDFQPTLAIGALTAQVSALDGNRLGPNTTIWAATGEGNFSAGDVQGVGVLKSTDGGATWQLKQVPWPVAADGSSMFDRTSLRRILIDGRNSAHMWLAGDGGVFRSTDAGETWQLVTTLPYFSKYAGDCWYVYYTDMVIDDQTPAAGQPSHIYIAHGRTGNAGCSTIARVDNGVFRSTDGGATWTSISTAPANCPGTIAGSTSRGYTCSAAGADGFTWGGLSTSAAVNGNQGRISLIHSASNKKKIYALVHDVSNSESLGVYYTNDASAATVTWTAAQNTDYCNGQCWYDMTGAVDPSNDANVMINGGAGSTGLGGDNTHVRVSANSGGTFNATSRWNQWGRTEYTHADHHHAVWIDASHPPASANDWVYVATDGGFFVGTVTAPGSANGITWVDNNNGAGAATMQVYGLGQSAQNANRIHAGVQDNGQPRVDLDASGNVVKWYEIRGGDGGFSATDRNNDAIAYNEYVYGALYRTTNATYSGTTAWTWSCIRNFGGCTTCGGCNPDNSAQFINAFTLSEQNQARAYAPTRKVYRWNGGTTWVSYSPDLTTTNNGNSVLWVHSAKNTSANTPNNVLWAVTENGKVWYTANAGSDTADSATWVNVTKAPLPNRAASWVETHPNNWQWAIVTFLGFNSGHVFLTKDAGATWVDISGELPNEPFNTIAVDPSNPNRVFVASDMGVYVNEDAWNGTAWFRVNNGTLPYQKIYSFQFSPAADGKLRAGTHGRGIWELSVAPNSACGGSLPAAPTGVTTTPGTNQVTVSWNAVAGATSYRVYRTSGTSCPPETSGVVVGSGITGTSFVDLTALNGTTYTYRVTALNASNCEGTFSSCASSCPPSGNPVAPTGMTATAGANSVSLTWTAAAGMSYEVWRLENASCPAPNTGTRIATGIATGSYTDTSALNGTNYTYRIRAYSGNCLSDFSSCVSTCPPSGSPAAPSVTASAGSNQVVVSWASVPGAATYEVWRLDNSTCPATSTGPRIASGLTGTSYTDTTAVNGTDYTYSVRAVNGSCVSNLSNCVAAKPSPCTPPVAPATVTASATGVREITVSWSAVTGATSYKVYRADGACTAPSGSYSVVASGVTGTSFVDTTAVEANRYSYKVVTTASCDSALSDSCAWAEAYGDCLTAPTFAGLASAAVPAGTACQIDLSWTAGTSNCGGSLTYTIYRSTTSGFTPAAVNRIASGVSGTTFADTLYLQAGATYYYIVRAVDSRGNAEDTNLVQRSAVAGASCTTAPWDVQVFTVTASSTQNLLEWWNPSNAVTGTSVSVNYKANATGACTYPTGPADSSATTLFTNRPVTAGSVDTFVHSGLTNGTAYCYAIWVKY